jgi:hypothetical protein
MGTGGFLHLIRPTLHSIGPARIKRWTYAQHLPRSLFALVCRYYRSNLYGFIWRCLE